jgi:outer membrane protease
MTTGKVTRQQDREHNYSLKITFEPDYDNSRHSAIVGEGAYFYTDEDYVIYTDENGVRLIE